MTDKQQHPITPPPELVEQWRDQCHKSHEPFLIHIANCASQWGADQELEACCEWMVDETPTDYINALRAARRPKLPSLKEQALARLEFLEKLAQACGHDPDDTIRRALEALPDD